MDEQCAFQECLDKKYFAKHTFRQNTFFKWINVTLQSALNELYHCLFT